MQLHSTLRGGARALVLAASLLALAGCTARSSMGTNCSLNSDCASPFVCNRQGLCAPQCRSDRDCIDYRPTTACSAAGECVDPTRPDAGLPVDVAQEAALPPDAAEASAPEPSPEPAPDAQSPEPPPEAGLDAAPEAAPDAALDVAPDAPADARPDVPADVAPPDAMLTYALTAMRTNCQFNSTLGEIMTLSVSYSPALMETLTLGLFPPGASAPTVACALPATAGSANLSTNCNNVRMGTEYSVGLVRSPMNTVLGRASGTFVCP